MLYYDLTKRLNGVNLPNNVIIHIYDIFSMWDSNLYILTHVYSTNKITNPHNYTLKGISDVRELSFPKV